jgi:Ca-activated chloride channel family protein
MKNSPNSGDALVPTLSITPLRSGVQAGSLDTIYAVVRVTAPDRPAQLQPRPPVQFAIVLDRSGSMAGKPLKMAMACVKHFVAKLRPDDEIAMISFSDEAVVHQGLKPLGDGVEIREALQGIEAGGDTNLHGGWDAASQLLEAASPRNAQSLRRILLVSDGIANVGEVSRQKIARRCALLSATGITTSTFGVGGNFNERLMLDMARSGRGNAYYGAAAEDLVDGFDAEADQLSQMCARRLALTVRFDPSTHITVPHLYEVNLQDGILESGLPDLAFGAESWGLLMIVPRQAFAEGDKAYLAQIAVSGVQSNGVPLALPEQSLALPVLSKEAYAALPSDTFAQARVQEVMAANQMDAAHALVRKGLWDELGAHLKFMRAQFADHAWVMAMAQELEELVLSKDVQRISKEAAFAAESLLKRMIAKGERQDELDAVDEVSYLKRKKSQGRRSGKGPELPSVN